jgi:hypothetical protein
MPRAMAMSPTGQGFFIKNLNMASLFLSPRILNLLDARSSSNLAPARVPFLGAIFLFPSADE